MNNKSLNKFLKLFSFIVLLVLFNGCEKEDDTRKTFYKPIDPTTQPSEFSRALIIPGVNVDGFAPKSSNSSAITIENNQPSASISNDNILFIPFTFQTSSPIDGLYLQVENADNYWIIPVNSTNDNSYVANVGIPPYVYPGDINIFYQIYDSKENVSEKAILPTTIVPAEEICNGGNSPNVAGSDGLNVRSYLLGDEAGIVRIEYETYSIPDRVDIRYNNQWVKSMGSLLSNSNPSPPIKRCADVTSGDGFRGESGVFEIQFDPAISRKLDVYVSGCLDGGTAWNYQVICGNGGNGNEAWYDNLPDCPCTYLEAQNLTTSNFGEGEWLDCGAADEFHFGAVNEIRWAPDGSNNTPGQQCTYDASGLLITAGIAAGSPDRVSPKSCGLTGPYAGSFSLSAPIQHSLRDVLPWKHGYQVSLPCEQYLQGWKANDGNCGFSNPVSTIDHLTAYSGIMTCEEFVWLFQAVTEHLDSGDPLRKFILGNGGNLSRSQLRTQLLAFAEQIECNGSSSDNYCKVINTFLTNL